MFDGKRILQVAHNHPSYHAGGTEIVALALHRQALRQGLDSWFLSAATPDQRPARPGADLIVDGESREASIMDFHFDLFRLSQTNRYGFLDRLKEFLEHTRPEIVHIHHVLSFGLESLFVIRETLPKAKIVLTLHDYYFVCPNRGQLFKRDIHQRCKGPELHSCKTCLPDRSWTEFELRFLDIKNALQICDSIISPSLFLKQMVEPLLQAPNPIEVIRNGCLGSMPQGLAQNAEPRNPPFRFGFFGNISQIKGVKELMDATALLKKLSKVQFSLVLHGSMLIDDGDLRQAIDRTKAKLGMDFAVLGPYRPEEIGVHMGNVDCVVFPSVWWENAPLVLYEAMNAGKPVIAFRHGGGEEILRSYEASVLVEEVDVHSLANSMASVLEKPPAHTGTRVAVRTMEDVFRDHLRAYEAQRKSR